MVCCPEVESLREFINEITVGADIGGGVGARTTERQYDNKGEYKDSKRESEIFGC